MKIKPGVDLRGIQPQMAIAAMVAEKVYAANAAGELCITSAVEGQHMQGSLHYKGMAIDVRLPSSREKLAGAIPAVLLALRQDLGAQFDVVLEKDHIHVEFDPK